MEKDLYKEWVEIGKNNSIIRELIYEQKLDEIPRCKDGNIYFYGDDDTIWFKKGQRNYLPDNFIVYGCLNINNDRIKSLPNGLVINGDFSCIKNLLNEIPPDLIVIGDFNCSKNRIKELPSTIKVDGDMWCSNNKLKSLPNMLDVAGDIWCDGNDFNISKSTQNNNIYVNEEYQDLQDRYIKITKLLSNV